jgi:hypothetical protein
MLVGLHHHTTARVLICAEWIAAFLGSVFAGKTKRCNGAAALILNVGVVRCDSQQHPSNASAGLGSPSSSVIPVYSLRRCCSLYFPTACSDLNAPSTTMVELSVFVGMGAGFLLVWDLLLAELSSAALTLLILGNVCYVVGIAFFILGEYKPIYHVVWHLFVVIAAALHWFCVYFFIVSVDITSNSFTKARVVELVDTMQAAASATASMMHNSMH